MGKSTYEKSPHVRFSSPEDRKEAFKRSIKVLRGSSERVTFPAIAKRAASYVPERYQALLAELRRYSGTELEEIGFVETKQSTTPKLTTRPICTGDWSFSRNRPRFVRQNRT